MYYVLGLTYAFLTHERYPPPPRTRKQFKCFPFYYVLYFRSDLCLFNTQKVSPPTSPQVHANSSYVLLFIMYYVLCAYHIKGISPPPLYKEHTNTIHASIVIMYYVLGMILHKMLLNICTKLVSLHQSMPLNCRAV